MIWGKIKMRIGCILYLLTATDVNIYSTNKGSVLIATKAEDEQEKDLLKLVQLYVSIKKNEEAVLNEAKQIISQID